MNSKSKFPLVYVILASDGSVKVGVSKNPKTRIANIQTGSGKKICKEFLTEPCVNAYEIEKKTKEHFNDFNILGEWFEVEYEEMVSFVKESFDCMADVDFETARRKSDESFEKTKKTFENLFCDIHNQTFSKHYIENTLIGTLGIGFALLKSKDIKNDPDKVKELQRTANGIFSMALDFYPVISKEYILTLLKYTDWFFCDSDCELYKKMKDSNIPEEIAKGFIQGFEQE